MIPVIRLVLLVITGKVIVVDSNVTRSRGDRAQLSVLLDTSLVAFVRSAARVRGMSIVAFVEDALEVALDGYIDAGTGSTVSVAEEGSGLRQVGGRDRVASVVEPVVAGRVAPDWDAIFAAGRTSKVSVSVPVVERDPIEDIA